MKRFYSFIVLLHVLISPFCCVKAKDLPVVYTGIPNEYVELVNINFTDIDGNIISLSKNKELGLESAGYVRHLSFEFPVYDDLKNVLSEKEVFKDFKFVLSFLNGSVFEIEIYEKEGLLKKLDVQSCNEKIDRGLP